MSFSRLLLIVVCVLVPAAARAFPPAPFHTIYGIVRDEHGRPLNSAEGTIILNGSSREIIRAVTDANGASGMNYALRVPMDAGTNAALYQVTAMRPLLPFTITVVIDGVTYVPLQVQGKNTKIGQPGEKTRLDLTLGVDRDHDGLPDAWEQALVDADTTGKLKTIADVRPGDDLSGNGLTNLEKFLSGVNALDQLDGVKLEVIDWAGGVVHLRFLGVTGHSYRIRASADTKTWSDLTFTVDSKNLPPTATYRPTGLEVVDVSAPWADGTHGYFQLFTQ